MIEIPCTLRCDGCKETTPAVAEAKEDRIHVFVITDSVLPVGWCVTANGLRCPRCNGAK